MFLRKYLRTFIFESYQELRLIAFVKCIIKKSLKTILNIFLKEMYVW